MERRGRGTVRLALMIIAGHYPRESADLSVVWWIRIVALDAGRVNYKTERGDEWEMSLTSLITPHPTYFAPPQPLPPIIKMDFENYFDYFSLFPYPRMEQPQYLDRSISDLPVATPSYIQPPQAPELHLEFSQTFQASQIPRDQETAGLPGL